MISSTKLAADQEIAKLKNQQADLVTEKNRLQVKVLDVNTICEHTLPHNEYLFHQREKGRHVREIAEIDARLSSIKRHIRDISIHREGLPNDPATARAILFSLKKMEEEYKAFSQDETRLDLLRKMAAEFSAKLSKVIENIPQ